MYLSIYKHISKEIYYKGLAHMIMASDKSYNVPSTSWRPREAGGVVQRPESWPANGKDSSKNLKAWEPGSLRAGED